jgi:putative ABC transport system permease protein
MIRHIAIAAFRNMAGSKLISAIAILGLSAGIATALLMGLVVRNQMSFDHFIPGHERTYRFFWQLPGTEPGQCAPSQICGPPLQTATELERYPAIESTARLQPAPLSKVSQGAIAGWEEYAAVDPAFFTLAPLPVAHGALDHALTQPGGAVITRAIARKYFGRDDVAGRTLIIAGVALAVRAVLEDYPPHATTIQSVIFVSWNDLARMNPAAAKRRISQLYFRLKPGAGFTDAQATEALRRTADLQMIRQMGQTPVYESPARILPLDRLNLWESFNSGTTLRLAAAVLAGALVLLIAGINFVNLMVARTSRRQKEVGVRKASGGGRAALTFQFLGEALVTVVIAAAIGVALAEWLLPAVNALLDTNAVLAWNDPLLLAGLPAAALLLALAVGLWPALILSGFRPALVLRGAGRGGRHASLIRNVLVTVQFSILITLAIAGTVMWLQRDFAAREALGVDSDQMLLVKMGGVFAPTQIQASQKERAALRPLPLSQRTRFCSPAFVAEVRKLPGVQGAVCSDALIIGGTSLRIGWEPTPATLDMVAGYTVDPRLFALYGVKPLAGTLPQAGEGEEAVRRTGTVINLSAARKLGFASPQAAIGQNWITAWKMSAAFSQYWTEEFGVHAVITAVVPDFSFGSVREEIPPTLYSPWSDAFDRMVHIKLSGQAIPETLAAIDRIYARSGIDAPLDRVFVSEHMQALYRDMTRNASFFAGISGIAILLACLGLVGVAVATAERRTKEIGIRKVMGATTLRIVGLLLWRFSLPVLLANAIAWPVAYWLMQRWLAGFAYRIDLHWWIFASASGAALLLALLTVMGQAIQAARQKPVLALRYE